MAHAVSNRFFYAAIVFALAGMVGGIYMAASHDHAAAPAHAHLLLIGWVSMAIFGLFYRLVPQAVNTLAIWQWWLMIIAIPFMTLSIAMIRYGQVEMGEPIAATSSLVVLTAMVLFAINVVRGLSDEEKSTVRIRPAE